jgi:hypothetical protein
MIGSTLSPLSTDEILNLGIQIADGLDAAHSKGIMPRFWTSGWPMDAGTARVRH